MKYLKYCDINVIIVGLIIGMIAQTFYFPCLTNHLVKNFNLSVRHQVYFLLFKQ